MRPIIIISFLMLVCGLAQAQNLMNKSTISIGPTSVLYVKDTIFNDGVIVNNGDMQVGGSWINHAEYDAGEGQITFNSDLPQIINHNDQAFSKLTLSGGGEKLFLADITVENELNLTDGILVSQNDSRIVIGATAQVTGGSDASHIRGPVYHQGSGNKVFPVGNGALYLPVEILSIQGSTAEIGVTAVELDGESLTSRTLGAISTDRYWRIDVISGSLNNSRIVLPVRNEAIVSNEEDVVVAQSASLDEDFESLGRSAFDGNATSGRVTSDQIVSKALVAIGTASAGDGIIVYNALSPNGDERNDELIIGNIESFRENKFTVFNRWGDKVFEIQDYDNKERVFRGVTNIGGEKELSSGTYFYTIETKLDGKRTQGFLVIKR